MILAGVMLIGSLTACGQAAVDNQEIPELLEPAAIKAATAPVERGDLYQMAEIAVMALPKTEKLYFEPIGNMSGGQIQEILAVPGEFVTEGQVLMTLSTKNLDEAIASWETTISYTAAETTYVLNQASIEVDIAKLEQSKANEELSKAEQTFKDLLGYAAPLDASGLQSVTASTASNEGTPNTDGQEAAQTPAVPAVTEALRDELFQAVKAARYGVELADIAVRQAENNYSQQQTDLYVELGNMQAEVKKLKESYDDLTLTAPFTGRLVELYYGENDWVSAYDTVMILADETQMLLQGPAYNNGYIVNALKIDAYIDQQSYAIEYQAYDADDYLKRKLSGEELPTMFVLSESETKPLSYGQTGMVRIYQAISKDTLLIPIACLMEDSIGHYVYVDVDGQKEKTYVSVGITTTISAEILDGLEEGGLVYVGD